VSIRAITLAAVPVLLLLAAIWLVAATRSDPESPLDGISAAEFASLEITIAGSEAEPATSRGEAIETARSFFGTGEVRQTLLAHAGFEGHEGELVWVLNYYPGSVPAVPGAIFECYPNESEYHRTVFAIAFVDAETGEYAGSENDTRFLFPSACQLERPPEG
jgi:hypothetical protein